MKYPIYRPRCVHRVVYPMDNCIECILEENAELKEINQTLWAALTPEKRHELNLKFASRLYDVLHHASVG